MTNCHRVYSFIENCRYGIGGVWWDDEVWICKYCGKVWKRPQYKKKYIELSECPARIAKGAKTRMIDITTAENDRRCDACGSMRNVFDFAFRAMDPFFGLKVALCGKCITELRDMCDVLNIEQKPKKESSNWEILGSEIILGSVASHIQCKKCGHRRVESGAWFGMKCPICHPETKEN